jgi:DNA-damage-inducible protein D
MGDYMVDKIIKNYNNETFEDIKHIDENGSEYWYAREIMTVLQYTKWQNFEKIIEKSKDACKNSDINVNDHFTDISKMVRIGSGAKREQIDYKLSRYACYLIAQNGDSRKKVIALAQTYFAVQTRKQEITEKEACNTHNKIGKIVRKAIKEAGGTMPEDLPTPKKSLKQLEKEKIKQLDGKD